MTDRDLQDMLDFLAEDLPEDIDPGSKQAWREEMRDLLCCDFDPYEPDDYQEEPT